MKKVLYFLMFIFIFLVFTFSFVSNVSALTWNFPEAIYCKITGCTMQGDIDMGTHSIINATWVNMTYLNTSSIYSDYLNVSKKARIYNLTVEHLYGASPIRVYNILNGTGIDMYADNFYGNVYGENSIFGNESGNVSFNDAGQMTFEGRARPAHELIFKATNAVKGVSAPSDALRDVGASGNVKEPVISFSSVSQQDVYGSFHPPDDLDNSTNVEFHLMWIPADDWTSGAYNWTLEYIIKCEDASYEDEFGIGCANTTLGTPTKIWESITPNNAIQWIETEFTSTIPLAAEQVMTVHFYRDVANDDADAEGEVRFFEAQYYSNKLGEYDGI